LLYFQHTHLPLLISIAKKFTDALISSIKSENPKALSALLPSDEVLKKNFADEYSGDEDNSSPHDSFNEKLLVDFQNIIDSKKEFDVEITEFVLEDCLVEKSFRRRKPFEVIKYSV
jgi:hypothetical protein